MAHCLSALYTHFCVFPESSFGVGSRLGFGVQGLGAPPGLPLDLDAHKRAFRSILSEIRPGGPGPIPSSVEMVFRRVRMVSQGALWSGLGVESSSLSSIIVTFMGYVRLSRL